MPQRFAQLSDPHLSSLDNVRARDLWSKRALGYLSWHRKRRFEHRREVLDALQRDLAGIELDQLLVTGDLTHIGLPEEFRQASDWLHALGDPAQIALVPGNHDACVAAPWQSTFALWQDYMASDRDRDAPLQTPVFPSLRVRGNIAFIGLSTACPKPPLMATGTAPISMNCTAASAPCQSSQFPQPPRWACTVRISRSTTAMRWSDMMGVGNYALTHVAISPTLAGSLKVTPKRCD